MNGNIKYLIVGVVVVLVLVFGLGGFLFLKYRTTSNAFTGNLSDIKGNSIFVAGLFYTDKKSYLPEGKPTDVEVVITSATKFKRIVLHIPGEEELKKTGGKFMVDDLKKDVSVSNFETFKKDAKDSSPISLEAVSSKNIWGKNKFEAKEITYRLAVYP